MVFESILLTGGCGFIGANLSRRLVADGVHVRVLDNQSRGNASNLSGLDVEIVAGDVRDADALRSAMRGMQGVIHLAAYGSVVESVTGLDENFDVNVRGTLSVLQAATRDKLKVVFASSGGAVTGAAVPPVNEDSRPQPASPYGASKACGEAYCHAFAGSFGLQTVALRFANVYGPHSAHKRGAVTNFSKALLFDEPIVVFGDGSATRDFIHVDDLCDGICAALDTPVKPGTVLHLATGVETNIADLVRILTEVAGRPKHPVRFEPKRAGELERNFASYDRAREMIGFEPRIALREGLKRTFEWFQAQDPQALKVAATDA
jgi:UDP-glucose 4-epimerase